MISLSRTQTHTPHLPSTRYSLDSIPIIVLSSLMTSMFLGLKETSQFHLALPLVIYLQYLPLQAAWAFLNPNFFFFLDPVVLRVHQLPFVLCPSSFVSFACFLDIGILSFSLNNFIYSVYASDS